MRQIRGSGFEQIYMEHGVYANILRKLKFYGMRASYSLAGVGPCLRLIGSSGSEQVHIEYGMYANIFRKH